MCGIVGYIGKEKKALDVLIKGLENLEYRGYDSAGVSYIKDDKIIIQKETGRIKNLKEKINFKENSHLGIGHTRWATHGKPNQINAHPHNYGKITIVHNGIIENYLELKNELISKGYEFISETDTEIAAGLLNYYYDKEKDVLESIKSFKKRVKGAYAIALICQDEPNSLYVIKKDSPLIIGLGKNSNYLASDILAILNYTNKYIPLADGYYGKITKDEVVIYDNHDVLINPDIRVFEGSSELTDKKGYQHYMLKEIYEEPDVVKNNSNLHNIPNLSKYKNICIVACGSAMHAGLIGKYLLETYAGIKTDVEIASEFRYKKLFIDKDTLVIAISQSGETADTLEAVKIAKKHGSHTLGIVNVKESSIARTVDDVIYTEAGREIAVATTKAYLAQVEILALITYKLIDKNSVSDEFIMGLKKLPIILESLLDNHEEYLNIAKKIYKNKDMFYIGRNIDYAICMEASLKIKEISYLHSEAYAAGELKHGTISLIEEGTPVIGVVTEESIADKTISNLKEVKSRGAFVIYLTTTGLFKEGDFYDISIVVPEIDKLLNPLVTIIPLQLIAYYVAKLNKCDIDKPKNLAKSVTVE